MNKTLSLLLLSACLLSASLVSLARPIRGASAASSEEFPANDPLPYGAIPVEYIESTGTQYIDTGYVYDNSLAYEIDCHMLGTASESGVFCGIGSGARFELSVSVSQGRFFAGFGSTQRFSLGSYDNLRHIFFASIKDGFFIDGILQATFGTNSQAFGRTLGLFMRDTNNRSHPALCRMYRATFASNDGIIFDFIPVRFTNEFDEPEGALYDRVSNALFRNQGTGSFLIGPDKE